MITCPDCKREWNVDTSSFCPTCGQEWAHVEAAAAFVMARRGSTKNTCGLCASHPRGECDYHFRQRTESDRVKVRGR